MTSAALSSEIWPTLSPSASAQASADIKTGIGHPDTAKAPPEYIVFAAKKAVKYGVWGQVCAVRGFDVVFADFVRKMAEFA